VRSELAQFVLLICVVASGPKRRTRMITVTLFAKWSGKNVDYTDYLQKSLADSVTVKNHAFCLTYYRCVGYMVIGGTHKGTFSVGTASLNVDPSTGNNATMGTDYVADIVAKLGVTSFE
jgi:hypothetical protein